MATKTKTAPKTRKPPTPPTYEATGTRKSTKPLAAETFAQSSLIPLRCLGTLKTKAGAQANVYMLYSDRSRVLVIPLNAAGAPGTLCFTVEVSELRPEDRSELGLAMPAKAPKPCACAKEKPTQRR